MAKPASLAARASARLRHPTSILALVLLLGFALRLIWPFDSLGPIDSDRPVFGTMPGDVPFGFHTDEGHNALDAWRIASEGWRPVFLERNNGREPLFMYLMAACMALFGPTIQAARLAGALAGLAAIAAQALLLGALPLRRPTRVALLSAAGLAFGFWPIAQARYALRANLLPVWVALMLWAWWRAIRDLHGAEPAAEPPAEPTAAAAPTGFGRARAVARRWRDSSLAWAALAGLFVGLAVHTHLTGRALPAVLAASALWVLVRERRPRVLARLALALLVALLVAWPQIAYFRAQPEMLSYRADQVSVLNPEVNGGDLPGTLLDNGWQLLKMPVVEGDSSWYHNIKRRPVFDDLPSKLAFLLGLLVFAGLLFGRAGRPAQSAAVLLAAALGVTLAPSWLSVGAPNYVRLTGIWPTLFLIPALGLDRAAGWLEARADPRRDLVRHAPLALLILAPAWLLVGSARAYFDDYAGRPEVYDAFNAAAVERGQALAALPAGPLYVTPALWNQSVIRFLNLQRPPRGVFDPRQGMVFPHNYRVPDPEGKLVELRALARYAFDPVERDAAEAFAERWPIAERADLGGRAGRPSADATNLISFTLYGNQIEAILAQLTELDPPIQFGPNLRLERLRTSSEPLQPGQSLDLALAWYALAPTALDHNFFLRLVSQADGSTLAQFDGPPLGGSYPTSVWNTGERILMPLQLEVAADAPAGPASLVHGWYDWRDGQRLPIAGDADAAAEIATLEIAAP